MRLLESVSFDVRLQNLQELQVALLVARELQDLLVLLLPDALPEDQEAGPSEVDKRDLLALKERALVRVDGEQGGDLFQLAALGERLPGLVAVGVGQLFGPLAEPQRHGARRLPVLVAGLVEDALGQAREVDAPQVAHDARQQVLGQAVPRRRLDARQLGLRVELLQLVGDGQRVLQVGAIRQDDGGDGVVGLALGELETMGCVLVSGSLISERDAVCTYCFSKRGLISGYSSWGKCQ